MGSRSRNLNNRDSRHSSIAEPDANAGIDRLRDLLDVDMPTLDGTTDGHVVTYDSGQDEFVLTNIYGTLDYRAAHGRTDGASSYIAAGSGTPVLVTWPVSIITDVAVCPLSFFTAGDSEFTVPNTGYYYVGFNIRLGADPQLFGATLELRLSIAGSIVKTFPVDGADWEVNYSGIFQMNQNQIAELSFVRVGAGFAVPVVLSNLANMIVYRCGYVPDPFLSQAFGEHTDSNFGVPGAGQDGFTPAWINASSEYQLVDPQNYPFEGHSNVNFGVLGPAQDGYLVSYDDASGDFVLISPGAAAAHALNQHTDTNLGAPGAGENGYVVSWDNGSTKYILSPPSVAGAHTILGASHSDAVITGVVTNGDIIQRVGGAWTNIPFSSLSTAHTLDSHSNVNTSGKVAGSFIKWNGTTWVISNPVLNELFDVDTTGVAAGNYLAFNGVNWVPQAGPAPGGFYMWAAGLGLMPPVAGAVGMFKAVGPDRYQATVAGLWQVTITGAIFGGGGAMDTIAVTVNGVPYADSDSPTITFIVSLAIGGWFSYTMNLASPSVPLRWNITAIKID